MTPFLNFIYSGCAFFLGMPISLTAIACIFFIFVTAFMTEVQLKHDTMSQLRTDKLSLSQAFVTEIPFGHSSRHINKRCHHHNNEECQRWHCAGRESKSILKKTRPENFYACKKLFNLVLFFFFLPPLLWYVNFYFMCYVTLLVTLFVRLYSICIDSLRNEVTSFESWFWLVLAKICLKLAMR